MKKLTTSEFIVKAKQKHGDYYNYDKTAYTGSHDLVTITCPIHGDYYIKASKHLLYGCRDCGVIKSVNKRKKTVADFITEASAIHNNYYCYGDVRLETMHDKISISCPQHGQFWQAANDHLKGHGCVACAYANVGKIAKLNHKKKYTKEWFIKRANEVHNNFYIYDLSEYTSAHEDIKIICPVHGDFDQTPNNHLAGHGCSGCSGGRPKEEFKIFIDKAKSVHGEKYSYIGRAEDYSKVTIICDVHGEFEQLDYVHKRGSGCPKCARKKRAKQNEWLSKMGVPEESREVSVKIGDTRYCFDGFFNGVVYEFWGDYWHGNPEIFPADKINTVINKTFGELYVNTQAKRTAIAKAGYKLIEIWESKWDRINAKDS